MDGFGANLPALFRGIRGFDRADFPVASHFLVSGTVYRSGAHSHAGAVASLRPMPPGADMLLLESSFLATSHSWSHSYRGRDPSHACLGFASDDLAYYFMADHPIRPSLKLNGPEEPTDKEKACAATLMARIVARRITKYNAQPLSTPIPSGGRRCVLVCDQSYADASTVYGRRDDADFELMLRAAIDENPDAEIWVKSHPDTSWVSKIRSGYYSKIEATDRVRVFTTPMNPFGLDRVDTVYVGTSQMGLEALMAGKRVITFAAPFYAGWGLTEDRKPIPHRHRRRDLASLFHYFYIWYSIYAAPTGRPPATSRTCWTISKSPARKWSPADGSPLPPQTPLEDAGSHPEETPKWRLET